MNWDMCLGRGGLVLLLVGTELERLGVAVAGTGESLSKLLVSVLISWLQIFLTSLRQNEPIPDTYQM